MITVNNKVITEIEFDTACNEAIIANRKEKLSKDEITIIANQLVDSLLLLEEAQKNGLTVTGDELNDYLNRIKSNFKTDEEYLNTLKKIGYTVESMKDKIQKDITVGKYLSIKYYSKISIDEHKIKEYYTKNEEHFYSKEEINASHILFNKTDKEKAEKIREELLKDRDFAETAKEYSQCPTSEKGGEIGFFTRGQMVPEFEQAAFLLTQGELSNLVETEYGYHIIKVNEKRENRKLHYDDVKDEIKKMMMEKEVNEMLKIELGTLRENADISIDKGILESKLSGV